jgi:hypothetical protein
MRAQTTEHARAEPLFKKQEQMRERAKVTAEYEAAQRSERTARLRALRLRAMLLAVIIAAEAQDEEPEY